MVVVGICRAAPGRVRAWAGVGGGDQRIRAFFFLSAINLSGSWGGEQPGLGDPAVRATRGCALRGTTAQGGGGAGAGWGAGGGRAAPVGAGLLTPFLINQSWVPHWPALCLC